MWSKKKTAHVEDVIRRLAEARHKDDLIDPLCEVEDDTGYEIAFIYDIFTEAIIDEGLTRDEVNDPEAVLPVWDQVITTAYEYDY